MSHPEEMPPGLHEMVEQRELTPNAGDLLLKQMMASMFGVDKYVMVIIGPTCEEHGLTHLELHTAGLERHEAHQALADGAVALARPVSD